MMTRLGTEYGGWSVDLDLIREGSVVIDAGVGMDSSFARELLSRKRVTVLMLDPVPYAIEHMTKSEKLPGMVFVPVAIAWSGHGASVDMRVRPNASHTIDPSMPGLSEETYSVPCVSLRHLIQTNDVSLVKMDIEGAEFDAYRECIGVAQVAIEFHVKQIPGRAAYMAAAMRDFASAGYDVIGRRDDDVTFALRNQP